MTHGIDAVTERYGDCVHKLADGFVADALIITAATPSDQVGSDAVQTCRRRGASCS